MQLYLFIHYELIFVFTVILNNTLSNVFIDDDCY